VQLSSIEPILLSINQENTDQLVRNESQPEEGMVHCQKHSKVDKSSGETRAKQCMLNEGMATNSSQKTHNKEL
jgi:hypothetical protein